jgi:hypothetical protein
MKQMNEIGCTDHNFRARSMLLTRTQEIFSNPTEKANYRANNALLQENRIATAASGLYIAKSNRQYDVGRAQRDFNEPTHSKEFHSISMANAQPDKNHTKFISKHVLRVHLPHRILSHLELRLTTELFHSDKFQSLADYKEFLDKLAVTCVTWFKVSS